jgi:uncharacterized protein YkvS
MEEGFATPYVRDGDTVVYDCDGKEGSIEFNGYYYVESGPPPYPEDSDTTLKPWEKPQRRSEWLPKKCLMSMTYREKEPYKIVSDKKEMCSYLYYNELKKDCYIIEIYKMEKYESTDEISQIEDGDEMMDVCFFPTNKMKIWFRVLDEDITPKHSIYIPKIMAKTLYATKEGYEKILQWGQNTTEQWYHPVSRGQFQALHTVKVGDIIEFIYDGLSRGVEVLEIGEVYDYPAMKNINGDFKIPEMRVERVILVKSTIQG